MAELNKKTNYFYDNLLDQEQLAQLIQLPPQLLTGLLKRCSKHFHKSIDGSIKETCVFMANYKQIMEKHSKKYANQHSVNICLHFALLYSALQIKNNQNKAAKMILKETQAYMQSSCDPILLASCLNNLIYLYYKQKKYKKALGLGLRTAQLLYQHLQRLNASKNKNKIQEDGVVFVNVLALTKKALKHAIKHHNNHQFLLRMLQMIDRTGYTFSHKYFGQQSILTAKFVYQQDSIYLPVYMGNQDESLQEKAQQNQFELKLLQQLEKICQILRNLNLEPATYIIRQLLVQNLSQSKHLTLDSAIALQESLKEQSPPVSPLSPERKISHVEHVRFSSMQVQFSFLQEVSISVIERQFQFLGHIMIQFGSGRNRKEITIIQANLIKILNVLNIYDILPYELILKRLSKSDLIRRLLMHFIKVDMVAGLQLFPRAVTVIDPFTMRFMGQESLILVNHVQFKRFRVAICPLNGTQTMYLQLDFKHKSIMKLFNLSQIQNTAIGLISELYRDQANSNSQQKYNYQRCKKIKIVEVGEFTSKVRGILQLFHQFLIRLEESHLLEITSTTSFSQNCYYYHFSQLEQGRGQFFQVKYRSNVNLMEINTQNSFQTYSPSGLVKVKGSSIYNPQMFFKDFGLHMRSSKVYLSAFCQLIVEKFSLKIFSAPFKENEDDLYDENSVMEIPFTSKLYKRYMMRHMDYFIPVTLELVTVNNYKPVGIKVSAYEPIKSAVSAVFIHIVPQYWQKCLSKNDQYVVPQVKRSTEDYLFKQGYFLAKWLTETGFQSIFSKLRITNKVLELQGIHHKFVLIDELLV